MKKRSFLIFIVAFYSQTIAYCQTGTSPLQTAFSNLKTLLTDYIPEKAYLQFDRPYASYVAGEIIYLKAYVTMGELHQPSSISHILHVDLIDNKADVLQSINIALKEGIGWGDFLLPENLTRGTYTIRAYTKWMRNEKEPEYFYKSLSISSVAGSGMVAGNTMETAQPSLQFFPEGGSFVAGLPSKIGFKALGTDGMGINLTGIVLDDQNKEAAKIKSSHLGIGTLNLIPQAGKTYRAKVTFANGVQLIQTLPVPDISGITLSVNNDDPAKLAIEVRANNIYFKENFNKYLELIVYAGGIAREYRPKLDNAYLGLDIPVKNLKTGIVRVSLFTGDGEPLNERLSFVKGDDLLDLTMTADKQSYSTRENVKIGLNARLKDQNVSGGSFSVSVIDESKILVDEDAGTSNLAYFLLTSDVKGFIEKPDYYFNHDNQAARSDLDALMLTQAYRRFVWKELMQQVDTNTVAFRPEKGVNIAGNLKTKNGKPVANCPLTLIGDTGGLVFSGETDKNGKFHFENAGVLSSSHYILKIPPYSAKNAVLTIEDNVVPPPVNPAELTSAYENNADILAYLQTSQNPVLFTAVNSGSTDLLLKNDPGIPLKKTLNYHSSNLGGPGHADQVISGEELKNLPTLSSGLDGLARGVQFHRGVPSLQTGMVITGGQQSLEPMEVFIDGTDLGAGVSVDVVNPQSVETVEILKGTNAAIYGLQGGEGVVVITTRQGGKPEEVFTKAMAPGIYSLQFKGIYKAREFYMPVYTNTALNSRSDHRTTIFWKPDIMTDANGKASFSYFNSDGTGTYRVCIEGIDSNGNLGRQVFRYQVK